MPTPIDLRTFYRAALLLPLLGMLIAVALHNPPASDGPRLGGGYPGSLLRGLVAYGLVTIWAWRQSGRNPGEMARLLWRIPLFYLLVLWLVTLLFAATKGAVAALWPEQAGRIAVRTLVHLIVGFIYVALVARVLVQLQASGRVRSGPTRGAA